MWIDLSIYNCTLRDDLSYLPPQPPPPPPPPTNEINKLLRDYGLYKWTVMVLSALLVLSLLWHVAQAFFKRLWLLPSHPSRVLALNAATLALLGILAKPAEPGKETDDEYNLMLCNVLICTMVGALMPSVAVSTNLKDMWTNVVGVEVLLVSVIFITFLQFFYIPDYDPTPTIYVTATEHMVIMASLFLMSLLLLMQAMALQAMMSEVKIIISERLEQLGMETKPGYLRASAIKKSDCSWAVVERNTRAKLMMVFTSKPEHLMARLPSVSIVGVLALLCIIFLCKKGILLLFQNGFIFYIGFRGLAIFLCGFICVWRWGRVALQEDRCFSALVFDAEPSYWRRKVNDFCHMLKSRSHKTQPNALEEGQYGFQEAVCYATAIFMLCFIVPIHQLLVIATRFFHIFSALLMHKIVCLPVKAVWCSILVLHRKWLFRKSCQLVVDAPAEPFESVDSLGAICLEGEDARIVGHEFAGAAARSIRRELKRANRKSDLRALISLLQSSNSSIDCVTARRSNVILEVLNQEGAPFVENLQVKHGYQFGWGLMVISLLLLMTKVEVTALAKSMISEAAMNACWQALEMMQLVDEQFMSCIVCSKETYARACAAAWSRLQTKKRRWRQHKADRLVSPQVPDVINQILNATLDTAKMQMDEFNKTRSSRPDGIATLYWSEQTVESYTMYTVCQNLSRHWMGMKTAMVADGRAGGGESNAEKMTEDLVEHINAMIGEFIACCISSLPIAVERSTTEAVRSGRMSAIEQGIFMVAQGKQIWEELQWSTLHFQADTLEKLGEWMD